MSLTNWDDTVTGISAGAHHARHENGGADEISVAGLSGLLADDQHVLDAEVTAVAVAHALATAANDFLVASGSGAFVKKTLAETLTILGKAAASGLASLDASSLVVQNPTNATATPTASKIPISDGSGKLDGWVTLSGIGGVAKSLFDAHTILYATADDTPLALTVNAQSVVGRITSGNIVSLTGAQLWTILTGQAGAAVSMNSQSLTGVLTLVLSGGDAIGAAVDNDAIGIYGGVLGQHGGAIQLWGRTSAQNGAVKLYTPKADGTDELVRLSVSGVLDTAVATWSNVTHVGIVLGGAINFNGQTITNTGILTLPTATGTIALTSDISTHAALQTGVHGISITALKTLTVQNSLTLTATDGATLAIGAGGALGSAAYTATTAYESSGAVATHAAVTTGVHGLAITAGQTLIVTTGGTLGSAAYTATTAYEAAGGIATHAGLTATHGATGAIVGTTNEQTLTLKTLTTPIIASFYQDAGKTKLMTVPDTASDTLVTLAATQELDNKTLDTSVAKGTWTASGTWVIPAVTLNGDISLGANKLKTTNLLIKEGSANEMHLRDAGDTVFKDWVANTFIFLSGLSAAANSLSVSAPDADDWQLLFKARDNGVGLVEVARLQGAADPEFRLGNSGNALRASYAGSLGFFGTAPQAKIVDARIDDVINSGDATTDGVIDAIRDAMITYGLISAA